MKDDFRDQIYNTLNLKETDELVEIWQKNDHKQWSETAFGVVKELLQNRLGQLPPQGEPNYASDDDSSSESNRQIREFIETGEINRKDGKHRPHGLVDTGVFERRMGRRQSKELISPTKYNLIMGGVLLWGFCVNWLMVKFIPVHSIQSIDFRLFLLGYFASCFLGVYLFKSSPNPGISFLGYNFVVIPFGLVINVVVSRYNPSVVLDAMRITGLVTVIMMALGASFPNFFQKVIGALSVALFAVIIVELVEVFLLGIHHDIIDWIVAIIFCGYIGYDWGRANRIPKTIDNAVDSAAALYMDIINLFLRILRILGRRRK